MKFAVWLRAFIDALMRTPYLRSLERRAVQLHSDYEARLRANDEAWAAVCHQRDLRLRDAENQELQVRQDLTERLRDKDAVIADLKVRLAIAETDVVREKLEKQPRKSIPVPDFGGPVPFQDELAAMSLEVEDTQEKPNAVS